MARHATWAALAVAMSVIVGCGPGKELPNATPKAPDDSTPTTVKPAASESAAKAYIEKAVKAYTGGKPELVARGKASRAVLKGKQHKLDDVPVQAVRNISAVWPDRYLDTDEQQIQERKGVVTAYLHRPNFIVVQGNAQQVLTDNAERERNFAADATGQHWMALLLPLTDPKAVVYDLQPSTFLPSGAAQAVAAHTLKLSLGEFPPYQLTFDAKTDFLVRVEYDYTHYGTPTRWTWTMTDHKVTPEGLFLPTKTELRFKTELRSNSTVGEEWEVQKREFPEAIADAEFSPKK